MSGDTAALQNIDIPSQNLDRPSKISIDLRTSAYGRLPHPPGESQVDAYRAGSERLYLLGRVRLPNASRGENAEGVEELLILSKPSHIGQVTDPYLMI